MSRTTAQRLTNFAAALVAGALVALYNWRATAFLQTGFWTTQFLQDAAAYVGSFAAAAAVLLVWRGASASRYGWLAVAALGAALCAAADAYLFRQAGPDAVFSDLNLFPVGLVLYSLFSVPIMGVTQLFMLASAPRPGHPADVPR